MTPLDSLAGWLIPAEIPPEDFLAAYQVAFQKAFHERSSSEATTLLGKPIPSTPWVWVGLHPTNGNWMGHWQSRAVEVLRAPATLLALAGAFEGAAMWQLVGQTGCRSGVYVKATVGVGSPEAAEYEHREVWGDWCRQVKALADGATPKTTLTRLAQEVEAEPSHVAPEVYWDTYWRERSAFDPARWLTKQTDIRWEELRVAMDEAQPVAEVYLPAP